MLFAPDDALMTSKCSRSIPFLTPLFSILYAQNKIEKENEGLGTRV